MLPLELLDMPNLRVLSAADGNSLFFPPVEIVKQGWEATKSYLLEARASGTEPSDELKYGDMDVGVKRFVWAVEENKKEEAMLSGVQLVPCGLSCLTAALARNTVLRKLECVDCIGVCFILRVPSALTFVAYSL